MAEKKLNIGVIIASTRPVRNGTQIADWVKQTTSKDTEANYTYLDLAEINLPFLAEPKLPSMGDYELETTKKWAAQVEAQDGFLIIIPEYNHSYPASLKNAFDTLYSEWAMKPVGYVGYGSVGGARSIEAFSNALLNAEAVPLTSSSTNIMLFNQLDENGNFSASEYNENSLEGTLGKLKHWAKVLKAARQAN